MKPEDLNKIEMISQPLLTEEGLVNPAAINELESTIMNMPKTYDRLGKEPEWVSRKDQWIFRSHIVGAFAKWACRQSPYGCPDKLENVCKYLYAALKSCANWNECDMVEASLADINKWLYDILYDQGVSDFDAWNRCKAGPTPDIVYTSRYSKEDPDRSFIDLDALLRNVCIDIRDERRKDKAFDERFKKEQEQR